MNTLDNTAGSEWFKQFLPAPSTNDVFQPTNFNDYVGQEDVKKLLKIAIQAAKAERRSLPSIMLVGGFGLGKTSLAQLIVKEFGGKLTLLDGASVNKQLPSGLVVIDEIHNLSSETCDSLNMRIDQGLVQVIGCTTDPGNLPGAFRSRFRIFQLRNYSESELVTIAEHICTRKHVTATKDILYVLAQRSRSNARQLTTLLSNVFDAMAIKHTKLMTMPVVLDTLNLLGVDAKGYLERDREYVRVLPKDRPVGLNWLSSVLGIGSTTIQDEIEPYLLQTGVIDRTPKGRIKIRDI